MNAPADTPAGKRISIRFRELRPADLDSLYFLHQNHLPEPARRTFGALQAAVMEPGAGAMVTEAEDPADQRRVIGAMVIREGVRPEWMVLDSLVVEPRFRRQGLGRRLVAWACRGALAQQRPVLVCLTGQEDKAGEDFLRKVGFEATQIQPRDLGQDSQDEPASGPGTLWKLVIDLASEPEPPTEEEPSRTEEKEQGHE